MDERLRAMDAIFNPRAIAFVGASNSINKWGFIILYNLIMGGFPGPIYPVNPREKTIIGRPAYPRITDIPGPVDLAIFTIPATSMLEALAECEAKGIHAGIVISAGFSETGPAGEALQRRMVERARDAGMVLVGPNGQGVAAPKSKLYPWMPALLPDPGKIAVISQSGNVQTMLIQTLMEYGFGISKSVSVGNSADLNFEDYFRYLKDDEDTRVILAYVEGLTRGRDFFEAAAQTSAAKPIVILKAGRTSAGTAAVTSHTGVLAGQEAVFDAACRQAGMVIADSMEQAALITAGLVNTPLPAGRRVGMVTGGGGIGVLAADACERAGLTVVRFSDPLIARLKTMLPPWWAPGNPVDLVAGLTKSAGFLEIAQLLLDSEEIDGMILLGIGWVYGMKDQFKKSPLLGKMNPEAIIQDRIARDVEFCRAIIKMVHEQNKPLFLLSWVADRAMRNGYQGLVELLDQQIMVYPTINYAVDGFAAAARYGEYRRKMEQR